MLRAFLYKATVLWSLAKPLGGRFIVYIDSCTISQPSLPRPGRTVTCEPCTNGLRVRETGSTLRSVALGGVCGCVCERVSGLLEKL